MLDVRALIRGILDHRRAVLALLALSLAAALFSARNISVRFTFRDFFDHPGNPRVALLDRYEREFGDPAGSVDVLILTRDAFAPSVLDYIAAITHDLEREPRFSRVSSLTNTKTIFTDGARSFSAPLLPRLPPTPDQLARAREQARSSPLVVRRLISADGSLTVVRAQMKALSPSVDEQKAAVEAARRVFLAHPMPHSLTARIVGAPLVAVRMTEPLIRDQLTLTPLAIALILILLALTFRSAAGVAVPFLTVLAALIGTAGIFPLLGRPVDLISSVIPATLLVYGAVDPIFVMMRFLQKREAGCDRRKAIIDSYAELALPCFLTSLTTALGFFSFALLKLPLLRVFGIAVGIGVLFAFVTTLTLLPLLLDALPVERARLAPLPLAGLIDRALAALWRFQRPRTRGITLGAIALLALTAIGASHQRVSVAYTDLLPPLEAGSLIRFVERKLEGLGRAAIVVEGAPGVLLRPDVRRAMSAVERELRQDPMVSSARSLADLADTSDRDLTAELASADFSHGQIAIRFADEGSERWRALSAVIDRAVAREFPDLPVTVAITGFSAVLFPVLDHPVGEVLVGSALGFLVILLVQAIAFRSLRIALIGLLPNLIPAVACFALLAALGVTLRIGSVLFLGVSIGGLFNTTIHLTARSLQRRAEGAGDPDEVIEHALRKVGPSAFFTAAILSTGFAVFTRSQYPDLKLFGLLSLTTLSIGFISDMLITPVLLRRYMRFTAK